MASSKSTEKVEYDGSLVDAPPQLPDGEYLVKYLHHETAYVFKTPKVFIHFEIYDGPHGGKRVYAAYRVKEIQGKPRRGGRVKVRHSHQLYRQFVALSGYRERPDRIALRRLRSTLLRVRLRTVTNDASQNDLPPALHYTVVDCLLGVEAGKL